MNEKIKRVLFCDGGRESETAEEILRKEGLEFEFTSSSEQPIAFARALQGKTAFPAGTCMWGNTFKQPLVPALWIKRAKSPSELWSTFDGVISYVRHAVAEQQGIRINSLPGSARKLETSWPNVTCFDQKGKICFEREITKAPHPIQELLRSHDFTDWHGVMSMHIGTRGNMPLGLDRVPKYINKTAGTVLFPHDLTTLALGLIVVASDVRDPAQVEYVAYREIDHEVYKLYAEGGD
jgi:hypothetical protein